MSLNLLPRRHPLLAFACLAALCCSCSAVRPNTASTPGATDPARLSTDSGSEQTIIDPAVQPAGHQAQPPGAARIQHGSIASQAAVVSHAHDRRLPVMPSSASYQNPYAAGPVGMVAADVPSPEQYPDEYLFDGGDRSLPVHYDAFFRRGLDTEDTVGEFVDEAGDEQMRPSSRVAIYAPRFAAVRTVSLPFEGFVADEPADMHRAERDVGFRGALAATDRTQRERGSGVTVRSRASGLDADKAGSAIDQTDRAAQHEELLGAFEDLAFVRSGRFEQSDEAVLAYGIDAALAWSQDRPPVILAKLESGGELVAESSPAEMVLDEEPPKKPGDLRIVKLADKKTARRGDHVTFTLRYDNIGDRTVYHVKLVDNLSPRLEYVDDSATLDADGRLVVEPNGEGSLVLRWELAEPLEPHQGGVATFQTRVR